MDWVSQRGVLAVRTNDDRTKKGRSSSFAESVVRMRRGLVCPNCAVRSPTSGRICCCVPRRGFGEAGVGSIPRHGGGICLDFGGRMLGFVDSRRRFW